MRYRRKPIHPVTIAAFVLAAAFVFFAITGQISLISGTFPGTRCVENPRRVGRESARGTSRARYRPPLTLHTCTSSFCFQFWALGASLYVSSSTWVGYCKLTKAVGYRNKTVHTLGILTRNIAICLTFSVLSSLACAYAAGQSPLYL